MAVKGAFDALKELTGKFARLATPAVMEELAVNLGAESMRLLDAGFREQRDPYGQPWKQQLRTGTTMRDTAVLRNSFTTSVVAGGFRLGTNSRYARIHQHGGVIKAKRGKYLKFQIEVGRRVFTKAGKRIKRPEQRKYALLQWVMVPQVTIPKRQMVPEGSAGLWGPELDQAAQQFMLEHFDKG